MVLLGRCRACSRLARGQALIDAIGQHFAPVWINDKVPLQRRYGALVAGLTRAYAAGNPDRFKCAISAKVQTVRINQLRRMAHLTPQRDGKAADRGAETAG
mgnify:CR=1 FL=1